MDKQKLEKDTRAVFHEIHLDHLGNKKTSERLNSILSPESLNLPETFFSEKLCADLGCGSAVHGTFNLLNLGVKYVHAMDLDESFIEPAKKLLDKKPEFAGRWQLDIGSVLDLKYTDNYFDFVLCQNVIHHTADEIKALKEIHRILKPGRKAYVNVSGKGGLITRIFKEMLRDEYHNNEFLKGIVDKEFSEEWLKKQIDCLIAKMEDDGTASYQDAKTFLLSLKNLINKDLILSMKDNFNAPTYKLFTEKDFTDLLKKVGFSSWYRVARKTKYYNIRKIFSPFYYDYNHPLAKLFYGDGGALNFIITK